VPASLGRRRGSAIAAGAAVLLLSVLLALRELARDGAATRPFHFDEGSHALLGLLIAEDLREGDGIALLYDVYRQTTWTPLHSVLVGGSLVALGTTRVAARAGSAVSLILLGQVLFWGGWALARRRRIWAGAVAGTLAVTSPPLVGFADDCMTELPALAALAAGLVLAALATVEPASPRRFTAVGVAGVVTYFLRPSYGILLFASVVVTLLVERRRVMPRVWLYFLAPYGLLAIWFLYIPRVALTWAGLVNLPSRSGEVYSLPGLLFYPGVAVDLVGGPFMLIALGLLGLWLRRRELPPGVLVPVVFVCLQMLAAELHGTKGARFLFPVVPAVSLLIGLGLSALATAPDDELRAGKRRAAQAVLVAVLALALWRAAAAAPPPRPVSAGPELAMVAATLREQSPALLIAPRNIRPAPAEIDWRLATEEGALAASRAGALGEMGRGAVARRVLRRLPVPSALRERVLRVADRSTSADRNRTLYLGLPPGAPHAGSREDVTAFLVRDLGLGSYRAVVLLWPPDAAAGPADWLVAAVESEGFRCASQEPPASGFDLIVCPHPPPPGRGSGPARPAIP
jgi:hypothetical protein